MLCKPVCVCSPEFRYYPRAVLISIDRPISRVHRLRKPLLLPRFMAFSSLFLSQFVFEAQAGGRGGFFGLIVLARILLPLREKVRRIARRGWRERVDEFVLLYGYISFSYVRPLDRSGTLLLRLYLSLRVGISALLDILYIYIYIHMRVSPNSRFCYLFEAWLHLYRAGKVRWMGARRIGGNDSSERGEYDRGTKLAFGKPGRER